MTFPNHDRRKKLTREDVDAIRAAWQYGITRKAIAKHYRVSPEHISLVVRGYRRKQTDAR